MHGHVFIMIHNRLMFIFILNHHLMMMMVGLFHIEKFYYFFFNLDVKMDNDDDESSSSSSDDEDIEIEAPNSIPNETHDDYYHRTHEFWLGEARKELKITDTTDDSVRVQHLAKQMSKLFFQS
jgi:glycyl-tRNA synthetase alpha subunit